MVYPDMLVDRDFIKASQSKTYVNRMPGYPAVTAGQAFDAIRWAWPAAHHEEVAKGSLEPGKPV